MIITIPIFVQGYFSKTKNKIRIAKRSTRSPISMSFTNQPGAIVIKRPEAITRPEDIDQPGGSQKHPRAPGEGSSESGGNQKRGNTPGSSREEKQSAAKKTKNA